MNPPHFRAWHFPWRPPFALPAAASPLRSQQSCMSLLALPATIAIHNHLHDLTMTLTPEQKAAVASWIAAGDNLSTVQKRLLEEFNLSMTYMDVRFLVDDLDLTLKDPVRPRADASDVGKPGTAPAGGDAAPAAGDDDEIEDDALPATPDGEAVPGGNVVVNVDNVTLIPGALASGTVTFSDGVTGKWIVDNYGRPGFTEVSKEGYRPTKEDAQSFMQQLDAALRQKGF
ncbi:hypothetical protein OpiT1DRAFT_05398 [Opitutaceae bacterium TAV1]|nr:hypothetical protein OpiT1DRAFT_05398 [Opitutaceae bacterium TAV1]